MKKLLVLLLILSNAAVFSAADSDAYRNSIDAKNFEHHLELYNQAVASRDFAGIFTNHAALREANPQRAFAESVNNVALLKLISDTKPSEYQVIAQILNLFPPRSPISKAIREQNWQDLRTVIDHLEQQHAIQNNEPVTAPSPMSEPIQLPFYKGSSLKGMLILRKLKEDLLGEPNNPFASQEALTKFFFDYAGIDNLNDVLPDIAKEYFFYAKGNLNVLPIWLQPHFKGVSVQDLIDNDILPKIGSDNVLNLALKQINDLAGLQNIPDIGNVTTLELSNNKLTTITPGIFAGLNNLANLDLSRNELITITPGTFADLNNLRNLLLNFNNLTTIEPGAFAGLNNLRFLYLEFNNLTTIEPDVFAGLNNLKTLYLNFNNLTAVAPGTFAGLDYLWILRLNNNKLTTIAPNIFAGLNRLRHIYLSNNKITTVSSGAFAGLNNLNFLYLANNNIPEEDRARIKAEAGNNVHILW